MEKGFVPFVVMQAGVPVILRSPPGTAKTSLMAAFAERVRRKFLPVLLNSRDREDIKGYPIKVTDDDGNTKVVLVHDTSIPDSKELVIFLDELNTAPKHMAVLAQRMLSEKMFGERPVKEAWMAGAVNPAGQSPGARPLEPALVNRVALFEWAPPLAWWQAYMETGTSPDFPAVDQEALEREKEKYRSLVAAFLCEIRPDLAEENPKSDEPFCSIRSATNAADAMAAVATVDPKDEAAMMDASEATAGKEFSTSFTEWKNSLDLPSVSDVLHGNVDLTKETAMVAHLSLVAAATYVASSEDDSHQELFTDVCTKTVREHPEAVVLGLRAMMAAFRKRNKGLPVLPDALIKEVGDIVI